MNMYTKSLLLLYIYLSENVISSPLSRGLNSLNDVIALAAPLGHIQQTMSLVETTTGSGTTRLLVTCNFFTCSNI